MDYEKLKQHIGHEVEIVYYGKNKQNIALECEDCNEVLCSYDKPLKYGKLSVIANINIEIPTTAKTEQEAEIEAENYELPHGYVEDSFEIVKVIKN